MGGWELIKNKKKGSKGQALVAHACNREAEIRRIMV
jgi:hypothetical protein